MKFAVRGDGPPVLLLHGLPTSGRLWDFVVGGLCSRYQCIVVDLPGAGESPPLLGNALDMELYAQELEKLRVQLVIDAWDIIGHDAGSAIAVHYAARYGAHVRRLVLCSPPIFPEHTIPWFFRIMRTPGVGELLVPVFIMAVWPYAIPWAIRRSDPAIPEIVEAFRKPYKGWAGARRFLRVLRWGNPGEVLGKTAALLPDITAPTLVVSGMHDGAVPIRFAIRAAQLIPGAQLHLFACGHFIPLECPGQLNEQLQRFLTARG